MNLPPLPPQDQSQIRELDPHLRGLERIINRHPWLWIVLLLIAVLAIATVAHYPETLREFCEMAHGQAQICDQSSK